MKDTDIAYLAGVIDSDGCISIQKNRNCRSYLVVINVIQRDMALIENLYSVFGGSVNVVSTKHGINRHFYLRWQVTSKPAIKLIELVIPYLILKKKQAQVAYELYNEKESNKAMGCKGYTNDSISKQENLWLKIKSLNSPATTERVGSLTKEMRQSELTEMINRQRENRRVFSA